MPSDRLQQREPKSRPMTDRVEELESRVEQLEQIIESQSAGPSRRSVLASLAGVAGAGALGAGVGSQRAAAQEAVGQVGTEADPVDLFANSIDAESASIGEVAGLMYSTSDQPIPDNTSTQVEWNTVEIEDSDIVDADTGNDRFVIQEDGTYYVESSILWGTGLSWGEGDRAQLSIQGDVGLFINRTPAHVGWVGEEKHMKISRVYEISEGDSIEIFVEQRTGGEVELRHFSGMTNAFQVVKLG